MSPNSDLLPPVMAPAAKLPARSMVDTWPHDAVISSNNFINKSLSNWAFNVAVGCSHACRFCYVPSTSTIKQAPRLAPFGVIDPDEQWGDYLLVRTWNEAKFRASLLQAERTPISDLKKDGNRAVMYCSTTDPYQVVRHPDTIRRKQLSDSLRFLVRRSLELILEESTLNVRILTRSPLAKLDFDLFKRFKKRLLFGMSLPTLRNDLAKIYEPKAPAPSQRLETLQAARDAGLNVYVAVAPTYPESNATDLSVTLAAIARLKPVTVFHEPINIRADNVQRIQQHAAKLGVELNTEVFATKEAWKQYAWTALKTVEVLAKKHGLSKRLHLWPDKALMPRPPWISPSQIKLAQERQAWLEEQWDKISHWPA
jgi:DNA repair photolyase